jgi:hypothetical protein
MPVKLTKIGGGKVRVSTPNGVRSKATTPANAIKQRNLLNAIEHDPNFKPRKRGK